MLTKARTRTHEDTSPPQLQPTCALLPRNASSDYRREAGQSTALTILCPLGIEPCLAVSQGRRYHAATPTSTWSSVCKQQSHNELSDSVNKTGSGTRRWRSPKLCQQNRKWYKTLEISQTLSTKPEVVQDVGDLPNTATKPEVVQDVGDLPNLVNKTDNGTRRWRSPKLGQQNRK